MLFRLKMLSLWCAVKLQWIVKKNLSQAQKRTRERDEGRKKTKKGGFDFLSA